MTTVFIPPLPKYETLPNGWSFGHCAGYHGTCAWAARVGHYETWKHCDSLAEARAYAEAQP